MKSYKDVFPKIPFVVYVLSLILGLKGPPMQRGTVV